MYCCSGKFSNLFRFCRRLFSFCIVFCKSGQNEKQSQTFGHTNCSEVQPVNSAFTILQTIAKTKATRSWCTDIILFSFSLFISFFWPFFFFLKSESVCNQKKGKIKIKLIQFQCRHLLHHHRFLVHDHESIFHIRTVQALVYLYFVFESH